MSNDLKIINVRAATANAVELELQRFGEIPLSIPDARALVAALKWAIAAADGLPIDDLNGQFAGPEPDSKDNS